jgi:hypothetical protein
MASDKYSFSVEHEIRHGQVSAIRYGDLVRVLEPDADVATLAASYYVLQGAVPRDPAHPAHYGCPAGGKLCAACSGSPSCNGGPPPTAQSLLGGGTGGAIILVRRTARLMPPGPDGRQYLIDANGDQGLRIPIFPDPAQSDLSAALSAYRAAARIETALMVFHVYQITSAPPELAELIDKLIAVPALRAHVLSAALAADTPDNAA